MSEAKKTDALIEKYSDGLVMKSQPQRDDQDVAHIVRMDEKYYEIWADKSYSAGKQVVVLSLIANNGYTNRFIIGEGTAS